MVYKMETSYIWEKKNRRRTEEGVRGCAVIDSRLSSYRRSPPAKPAAGDRHRPTLTLTVLQSLTLAEESNVPR